MGNVQSDQVPAAHVRIYQNLLSIQAAGTRAQMIETLLSSPEHSVAARQAGIYGHLLHYIQVVRAGGAGPALPGERVSGGGGGGAGGGQRTMTIHQGQSPPPPQQIVSSQKSNEKAINYFSACLRILELEEEVALTPELLKSAYKKAVVRAHPDKGGSEKEFEAVTRAYAYLGEILRRIHGGRAAEGKVEAPTALTSGRAAAAEQWKHVEPTVLNPKNLNSKAFNEIFEKTRIPDPEEAGYGDWLKGGEDSESSSSAPKFSGKFNRDIFNQTFQDDAKKRGQTQQVRESAGALVAQEMSLASRMGYATELGRSGRDDYTVAANDPGLKYTDLKKAYTEYNTFSQETAGVQVAARSYEDYRSSREKAPGPLADHEMEALQAAERAAARAEELRQRRKAEEAIEEGSYFERMKARLTIQNS